MAEGADMARVERQPGFLHRTSTKIALAGSGLVLAVAGAIGVKTGLEKGSSPENSNPALVLPAIPQSTEGPKLATPIPSLTPEATHTPTATSTPGANPDAKFPPATPEAQAEVFCPLFSQKFCSQVELLERETSSGLIRFVGVNLPPGTPIYAPMDSQVGKAELKNGTYEGNEVSIGGNLSSDTSIPALFFRGDLDLNKTPTDVDKNGVVGEVGNTGVDNFGYNLVILIGPASQNQQNVEKYFRPWFPKAFEKPAKRVTSGSSLNQPPNYGGIVIGNNPR